MPVSVIVGIALLLSSLGLLRATSNRHIRGRLLLSASLFAAYTVATAARDWVAIPPDFRQQIQIVTLLAMAFGLVTMVVALSVNPWRVDRIPERFPHIVQDTLVLVLFGIAASVILGEQILTTTAVGAVVIGFALQDTLGNLFAGLAIQIEKPFRVGDWVMIGEAAGLVSEITWRATKIRTKAGNFVIVPNGVVAKDSVTNYSAPTPAMRLHVEVSASYDTPPNVVKSVIREALRDAKELTQEREPEVLLVNFADSGITYWVRFWVTDFEGDERAKDRARSLIYYAFRRSGITIPYHIEVQMSTAQAKMEPPAAVVDGQALAAVPMFTVLTEDERADLLRVARPVLYSAGESIVRQGEPGHSLFVITGGTAKVLLAATEGSVARLQAGDVFGEMSLLTGEPRTATVLADTDCELLEIDAEGFRRLVLANPSVLGKVTSVTAIRRDELERHRDSHGISSETAAARQPLLARVRQFLRL